jgi:hypothetical protein
VENDGEVIDTDSKTIFMEKLKLQLENWKNTSDGNNGVRTYSVYDKTPEIKEVKISIAHGNVMETESMPLFGFGYNAMTGKEGDYIKLAEMMKRVDKKFKEKQEELMRS